MAAWEDQILDGIRNSKDLCRGATWRGDAREKKSAEAISLVKGLLEFELTLYI